MKSLGGEPYTLEEKEEVVLQTGPKAGVAPAAVAGVVPAAPKGLQTPPELAAAAAALQLHQRELLSSRLALET